MIYNYDFTRIIYSCSVWTQLNS